ncbi:MAG TPA: hypothetical protein VG407_06930 [Caulobacteraceae bacterium]|nr:hypothetical protein [Caulobacteraceae bacterium]
MRIIAIAAFAAVSALAFSASAADQGQQKSDKVASTAKPDDGSRIICKGGPAEADTGTRLPPKKTCHTKREWDDIATQARQDFEQNMSHSSGTTSH